MESNYYKHLHSEESKGTKEYELHRAMKCLELIAKAKDRCLIIKGVYKFIHDMPAREREKYRRHLQAITKFKNSYNNIIHNLTKF